MPDSVIETLPAVVSSSTPARADDFMPLLTVDQAVTRKGMINEFITKVLKESTGAGVEGDYGLIPGAGQKKVLLKPGAEKLCSIFGLAPTYHPVQVIEDWTGADHGGEALFYYEYRCQLSRGDRFLGEAIGSANSWESKHRYRWLRADQLPANVDASKLPSRGGKQTMFAYDFAIEKAETTGQYGKPAEYWQAFQDRIAAGTARHINKPFKSGKDGWGYEIDVDTTLYRIPNPDVADVVNTLQKMAQKRALVAAVLVVTNCSDAFTQDLEDMAPPDDGGMRVGGPGQDMRTPPPVQPQGNGRAIPQELQETFDVARDQPDVLMKAVVNMEKQMVARAGDEGFTKFQTITAEYRTRVPKGKDNVGTAKELLLNLWDAYQALPKKFEQGGPNA